MKKVKFVIIALIICISNFCCKSNDETPKIEEHEVLPPNTVEMNAEQIKTADIQLGSAEMKQITSKLKVNGNITVLPQDIATLSSPFGGITKSISLVQGNYVSKGQTLALIENVEFVDIQQNYFETKAKLDFAEKEFLRQKELNKDNINSAKTFQQADSEYKMLKAQLNGYIQKLNLMNVNISSLNEDNMSGVLPLKAPMNGYIKSINVNVGKTISAGDVLCEIMNTNNLILELIVFEKDVLKISIGQKLSFSSPNNPDTKYYGTIYQVDKALDDDRSLKIYAKVDRPNNKLFAGMFINADIEVSKNEVLSIPSESIVQFEGKFYIFAFKENKKEEGKIVTLYDAIEVKPGVQSDGFTEIDFVKKIDFNALQIVIKGAYQILSKFKNSGEMSC